MPMRNSDLPFLFAKMRRNSMLKKTFIIINLFLIGLFVNPAFPQQEDFLAGYWAFEEGKGNEVKDQSGNNNHGTINGDVKWVDGQIGKALEFSPGACIAIPDTDSLNDVKELTAAMWLKLHALPNDWSHLLEKDGSYGITVNADKTFRYTYNSGAVWLTTDFNIQKETWHYIAMSWGKSGGFFSVDGEKVHEDKGEVAVANVELNIAHCGNYLVDGIIDEVKIWNKALTEDEIETAMKGGAGIEASTDKLVTTWSKIKGKL
jgi:hypothetical protein